jgi:hypothetical protein
VTPALSRSTYRNDTYRFDIVSFNPLGRRRIPVPAGQERNVSRITLTTAAGIGEQSGRGLRTEEADRAILAAATRTADRRGLGGMPIEEVAARAGIGKTAIYQWWPSRSALAPDAFLGVFPCYQPSRIPSAARRPAAGAGSMAAGGLRHRGRLDAA